MKCDEDRKRLIEALEAYLGEQITAFEFDERLQPLRGSKDKTVKHIAEDLWYYYDDIVDHKMRGPMEVWDVCQRYLFVLKTGLDVRKERGYIWGWLQVWTASLVVVFIVMFLSAPYWDGGGVVLVLWVVLGVVSVVTGRLGEKAIRDKGGESYTFCPFSSEAEMKQAMEKHPEFRMAPCPEHMARVNVWSKVGDFVVWLLWRLIQVGLGPVPLVWQSRPYRYIVFKICQLPEQ